MNKYIICIDDEYNIIKILDTFEYTSSDIELTQSEYEKAFRYKKFNPETREFSVPIELTEEISDKQRVEQLEETVGILAEQLAKQTLGM